MFAYVNVYVVAWSSCLFLRDADAAFPVCFFAWSCRRSSQQHGLSRDTSAGKTLVTTSKLPCNMEKRATKKIENTKMERNSYDSIEDQLVKRQLVDIVLRQFQVIQCAGKIFDIDGARPNQSFFISVLKNNFEPLYLWKHLNKFTLGF